ncbi:hypothetical protein QA649_08880 [Bradyrhizobium sp. CB1717]|uniref:hypothetical protein n=1 Tax=Bradyrhizobium sp. CB1717 TaxID=3039154 RepID=UPI0024B05984|nr:hypothetical protein [Bradyrhizobium sp. CB1717]WFU26304.1 hypothetical protein QA649_08880 [Bradyrhizobium sp. CB1717]
MLTASLEAAVEEANRWGPLEADLEEEFLRSLPPPPKVFAGRVSEMRVIQEGEPDIVSPARDRFYQSRERILEDYSNALSKAVGAPSHQAIKSRFDALLAEFDRQKEALPHPKPSKALRDARRKARIAYSNLNAAEMAVLNYCPQSPQEVADLLAFCSRDNEIFSDTLDLKQVMQNAAEALAECTRMV